MSELHPGNAPYSYVNNNPLFFNDPLGLDTVRVNGGGAHKVLVRKGDVLAWAIGETTSYYTYDPSNSSAVGGFIGAAIESGQEAEVMISSKAKGSSNGNNLIGGASRLIAGVGLAATLTETKGEINSLNMYSKGIRGGVYGNYQLTGRNYNLFSPAPMSSASKPISKLTKIGKGGGLLVAGIATVADGIGVYNYYANPKAQYVTHPAKGAFNLGMTYIGLKVNPYVGAIYGVIDGFYPGGAEGYSKDRGNVMQQSMDAQSEGIYTSPFIYSRRDF